MLRNRYLLPGSVPFSVFCPFDSPVSISHISLSPDTPLHIPVFSRLRILLVDSEGVLWIITRTKANSKEGDFGYPANHLITMGSIFWAGGVTQAPFQTSYLRNKARIMSMVIRTPYVIAKIPYQKAKLGSFQVLMVRPYLEVGGEG